MCVIVLILHYLATQVISQTPPVMTFNEGGPIHLLALGDKSGYGCSFEAEDTEKDLTCCYIHLERENNRGKRLCSAPSQPDECRQPDRGEYKVEELDGPVGWCKLTIFEARHNDAGVYKITFPFESDRYNQEITVTVAESSWLMLNMGLFVVLLVSLAANGVTVIFFLQNKSITFLKKIPKDVAAVSQVQGGSTSPKVSSELADGSNIAYGGKVEEVKQADYEEHVELEQDDGEVTNPGMRVYALSSALAVDGLMEEEVGGYLQAEKEGNTTFGFEDERMRGTA